MLPLQFLAQILVALSIAAPGVLSYRTMRSGEHGRMPAAGGAALFSALWAGVVGLILSVTSDTMIPGELWAALATAVVVTEAFFTETARAG
ncbi:hypothetical protein [Azospirillum sp. sgz301742]